VRRKEAGAQNGPSLPSISLSNGGAPFEPGLILRSWGKGPPLWLYLEASFGVAFRRKNEKSKLYLSMSKPDSLRGPLRMLLGYAVAVIAVGAAVVATLELGSAMKHTPTLFFCSVILSSWFGGVWPGVLAAVLSAIALDYYFIPPLYALGISLEEAPDMIVFVSSAIFVSWLDGEQKRAKDSLRQARDELDARVQERTAELKHINEQLQAEIAERKMAEDGLARAQLEAAHASRLALVGELSASIAHELNQPLGAILSNSDAGELLLESAGPQLDDIRQILADIRRDDLRASEVIKHLRALLRKGEVELQPLDLNEVVADALRLVDGESRRRGIELETELSAVLPAVRGDKTQLQQVLLNLVLNGMEAMAESSAKRRLTVQTASDPNEEAEVVVTDTGPGISPDRLPRLFDAFFTTKDYGMGLGLSIARSIIESHGGRIWAENNADGGAAFRFTLPNAGRLERRNSENATVG
jgi:signal transduction histidine kinase